MYAEYVPAVWTTRELVFVNEDLISGVELSRQRFAVGDTLQQFDGPKVKIYLKPFSY